MRAVAVLAVLGYHLDIPWMQGGFLGVDLFFVISGFLITRLLVDEHRRSGKLSLGGFWVRRFRRLVPPLVVVVGASVVATRLWGVPSQWEAMRGDAVASLGYVANWRFVLNETSYFDTLAGPSPLRHIWSLAVEEQWYVFWPLVMAVLAPFGLRGRRAPGVGLALLALAGLSSIWMAVLFDPLDISRVYYGTDTRAQQLLVGAALAWLTVAVPAETVRVRLQRARHLVSAVFVGFLTAVAFIGDEETWLYHGGLLALSVAGAVLVLAAAVPGNAGPLGWLASRPFVAVGLRSYGIYLWHWPVIVLVGPAMGIDLPDVPLGLLQVAVTIGLNELMFRFVETPVRSADLRPARMLFGWSAGGVVTAVAAVTLLANDLPSLPDVEVLRPDPETLVAADVVAAGPQATVTSPNGSAGALPPPAPDGPIAAPDAAGDEPAVEPASAARAQRLMLVGDSTAFVLASNRPLDLPTGWRATAYARVGCAITEGDTIDVGDDDVTFRDLAACAEWEADWTGVAALFQPDVSLVMVGAWEVLDHVVDDERLAFPSPEWADHVDAGVRRAVRAAGAGGGEVWLLRLPCMEQPDDLPVNATARNDPARIAAFNGVLERVAADLDGVETKPLDDLLCPGGEFLSSVDGDDLRYDGVHLTEAGTQLVWEWLDQALSAPAR